MNVLLQADVPTLSRLRRELPGRWHDLPLIQAAACQLEVGQLEELRRAHPGLSVLPDEAVSLPDTPDTFRPDLNVANPTLRAGELWSQGFKGKGVGVAVVDTGISRHKDFGNRILAFHDVLNGKSEPYDDHGHGSHVAGIVGGDGSDSNGRHVGIAPECGIVAIKAFNSQGKSLTSDVIRAIQWAVENRERYGIRVLNLSASGVARLSHQHDPLARAVKAAWERGITVVVAAGNHGPEAETIGTPAHSPVVLTVGASNDRGTVRRDDDRVADLSSRGPTPVDGLAKPDVVAPGVGITAADNARSGYVTKNGTSMAAPMVAGLAALLLTARPQATPDQLKQAVVGSAEKLPRGGGTHDQGSGLVDAVKALEKLPAPA